MTTPESLPSSNRSLFNIYSENNTQSVDISNKYNPVPQVKLSDSNQSFSNNELVDKIDWLAALLYSKEFLIEWRKRFLPRPSRSTIITALTLYLIAICSILQKQQGGRWFATLVDTKLPGFTTTYQKASWHNFENIISYYINRDITTNNNLICQRRLIDSIDLSKESALIRFDSSWNKQLQKQFSGFFTGQADLSADASKNHSEKSTFTSLPWYRIDACNPPTRIIFPSPSLTSLVPRSPALGELSSDTSEAAVGDTVGSTRAFASAEMKEDQSLLRSELPCNKSNTFTFNSLSYVTDSLTGLPHFAKSKNPLASSFESHIVSTKRSRFHLSDTITALQYCLPFSLSRERIFVENDTIPSKIDSPYSSFISDSDQSAIHLHTVDRLLSQRANAQSSPKQGVNPKLYLGAPLNQSLENSSQCANAQSSPKPFSRSISDSFQGGVLRPFNQSIYDFSQHDLVERVNGRAQVDSTIEHLEETYKPSLRVWFENIKKTTFGDDFNTFQNVLRYLFYSQGLPLPNDFAFLVESENNSLKAHSAPFSPIQGEARQEDEINQFEAEINEQLLVQEKEMESEIDQLKGHKSIQSKQKNNHVNKRVTREGKEADKNKEKKKLSQGVSKRSLKTDPNKTEIPSMTRIALLESRTHELDSSDEQLTTLHSKAESDYKSEIDRLIGIEDKSQLSLLPGDLDHMLEQNLRNMRDKDQHQDVKSEFLLPGHQNFEQTLGLEEEASANLEMNERLIDQMETKSDHLELIDLTPKSEVGLIEEDSYADLINSLNTNFKELNALNLLLSNNFQRNALLSNRLMSGYKFPELRKDEITNLFNRFVIRRLSSSPILSFRASGLAKQVILSPLRIKLPPALPFSFLNNVESPFRTIHSGQPKKLPATVDISIKYRAIRLNESKEVESIFRKLGRDYQDYLSRPKDSPAAIAISPSLEDDKAIEIQAKIEMESAKDEEKKTKLQLLQYVWDRDKELEKSKKLKVFAYENKFAFHPASKTFDFLEPSGTALPSWISSKLGPENMLSDRKYSFLGRINVLPKRLVGREQKEINEHILNPDNLETNTRLPDGNSISSSSYQKKKVSLPLRKLQANARRDLVDLLTSPDFESKNMTGSQHRTDTPHLRLRGKSIKSAVPHTRWQDKTVRSHLLGAPSRGGFVMPEITEDDWKKIVEWQLKKYFFEEKKRLKPLVKANPEKNFKIKRINIYLPLVAVRTPRNTPFEWPLTRLDYKEGFFQLAGLDQALGGVNKNEGWLAAKKQGASTLRYPAYKPTLNWGCREMKSLSSKEERTSLLYGIKEWSQDNIRDKMRLSPSKKLSLQDARSQKRINRQSLFEPLTSQSWLLIYRLFIAFAFKDIFKYAYRTSLKAFLIRMVNSPFGLEMTSPEFRQWLQQTPGKSFYTPKKRLQNLYPAGVGVEESISALSEVIWFLRNYGRGRTAPRGVLLVGPAGTEKTSLVQAIAGEAQVPVIVQSMSALTLTYDQPYDKLEKVFKLARRQAPCVLFLDDLDTIGQSREGVVKNDIGAEHSLFSLDTDIGETKLQFTNFRLSLQANLLPKNGEVTPNFNRGSGRISGFSPDLVSVGSPSSKENGLEVKQGGGKKSAYSVAAVQEKKQTDRRRINLLLRLLTEMDGIQPLNGVVVIASSERPFALDPALLRPGRFERRINLQLPNHTKRVELFKIHTKTIGHETHIPWDYLGVRSSNMSGVDIAAAINHSAIRAILDDTSHTVETLEHGLNSVIGLPNKEFNATRLEYKDPFHTSRLVFYEAARGVVQSLLINHPKVAFLSLALAGNAGIVAKNNSDAFILNQSEQETATRSRIDLETRLVGMYAGKAGELLHISLSRSATFDQPFSQCTRDTQSLRRSAWTHVNQTLTRSTIVDQVKFPAIDVQTFTLANQLTQSRQAPTTTRLQVNGTRTCLKANSWYRQVLDTGDCSGSSKNVGMKDRLRLCLYTSLRTGGQRHILESPNIEVLNGEDMIEEQVPDLDLVGGTLENINKTEDSRIVGWLWQSNLGFSELLTASSLIHLMVDRWYLYSKKLFNLKTNQVIGSLSYEQMTNEDLFPLFNKLSQELRSDGPKPGYWGNVQPSTHEEGQLHNQRGKKTTHLLSVVSEVEQERERAAWWEERVCREIEMSNRPYGKWYRIYLPKVEERERNEEWVPPDTLYHQTVSLPNLSIKRSEKVHSLKTWNHLYLVERDSSYHNVLINCFNTAFNLLSDNRELVDLVADHLLRFKKCRSHEISKICSLYLQPTKSQKTSNTSQS